MRTVDWDFANRRGRVGQSYVEEEVVEGDMLSGAVVLMGVEGVRDILVEVGKLDVAGAFEVVVGMARCVAIVVMGTDGRTRILLWAGIRDHAFPPSVHVHGRY